MFLFYFGLLFALCCVVLLSTTFHPTTLKFGFFLNPCPTSVWLSGSNNSRDTSDPANIYEAICTQKISYSSIFVLFYPSYCNFLFLVARLARIGIVSHHFNLNTLVIILTQPFNSNTRP